MSRVRLKLTFLFFGGGQSKGGLLEVYMVSSLSAMERVVEQVESEFGDLLYRDLGWCLSLSRSVIIESQHWLQNTFITEFLFYYFIW